MNKAMCMTFFRDGPSCLFFFLKGTNKKCGEHRCNKETKKLSLYPHTLQNKAC